jgi:hypothetical protein
MSVDETMVGSARCAVRAASGGATRTERRNKLVIVNRLDFYAPTWIN